MLLACHLKCPFNQWQTENQSRNPMNNKYHVLLLRKTDIIQQSSA
uniref:Uncharacterized protein n=1 Tax=Anopheles quadriannulatus TaxID=34691 RepID=A0A182XS11_ANOQN